MEFLTPYAFILIVFIPFLFVIKSKKTPPFNKKTAEKIIIKGKFPKKYKFYLLIFALILIIAALSRPVKNNGTVIIKAPLQNIVIALDISRNMDKKDLYPNRYEFAKTKIENLLKFLHAQNTALILFDKKTYLISPPTKDYESLIYLLKHTNINEIDRSKTSDVKNAIKSSEKLVKNPKIVIFTSKPYIPDSKNIYVYFCNKQHIFSNNVFNAAYSNENLKKLAELLNSSKTKDIKIREKTELFYYPLALGILILFIVLFFPMRRIK